MVLSNKSVDVARRTATLILYAGILAFGLYEAVLGLFQLYGFEHSRHHLFRLTGTFFNPGPYGGYLAMVVPVAVSCIFGKNIFIRVLSIITAIAIAPEERLG